MSWIQTFTGKRFDLSNPQPEMVCINDIAHALANVCRFTGHCQGFYSVAQHSVFVARLVPQELRLQALLHDATEAYIADLSTPLKRMLPGYRDIEERVWAAVATHFGLPLEHAPQIKHADSVMLMMERRDLLGPPVEAWYPELEALCDNLPQWTVLPWEANFARTVFRAELLDELKRRRA